MSVHKIQFQKGSATIMIMIEALRVTTVNQFHFSQIKPNSHPVHRTILAIERATKQDPHIRRARSFHAVLIAR